ncbi:hypothetical protein LY90DRAFT_665906 [Neocallimastix californiae]|uniref:Uncharacterized protein n=1 Tax=Neocallimastix californiae TaxID=1754190 RepID=A0A1Y2EVK5_9FUNG|nr:hypothetical protein LY90DRAFT_665906 [Neocallimastix californiae]|eukprot:ORY75166.1 hypothetical protein LY90DRAFT_665906 [Neocallimastix californiae]
MNKRKNLIEYFPIFMVYGLVIASFIDYNFNFCLFFVYCYYMVTNTDPGSPSRDAVNIISDAELTSYYSSLESSELRNLIESSCSDNSHVSTGALLKKEEKLDNDYINCNLTADNTNDHQISTATLNNKSNENNNYSIGIPLMEISSTSNTNGQYDGSTETLINSLNSNPTRKEQAVVFDTFLMQKPDLENGDTLHTVNKFDQISIDIDNDSIIERNMQKLHNNNNNENNNYFYNSYEVERQSINTKRNNEKEDQKNNFVCKKCFGFKPER